MSGYGPDAEAERRAARIVAEDYPHDEALKRLTFLLLMIVLAGAICAALVFATGGPVR